MRRIWSALALIFVVTLLCPFAAAAESVNVLKNGSFEGAFDGGLGEYWSGFNNGGFASYVYSDDVWSKVIYDGAHSQLITIHTKAVGGSQPDRYAGIYQTADVVAGKRYMFSFYGMVRSSEGSEQKSSWNYRVQIGFDQTGGTDPSAVTDWIQMDWPEHERLLPGRMQSFARGVQAESDKLTVFIRVWKKFPTVHEEANINIDAVSLVGPAPAAPVAAAEEDAVEDKAPADEAETVETKETIPQTGFGSVLPLVGVVLAAVAIGLTTFRLVRQGR